MAKRKRCYVKERHDDRGFVVYKATGKLKDRLAQLIKEDVQHFKTIQAYCRKIGARYAVTAGGNGPIVGFAFDDEPDKSIWKMTADRAFWCPRAKGDGAEQVTKKMAELNEFNIRTEFNKLINLTGRFWEATDNGMSLLAAAMHEVAGDYFILIPDSIVSGKTKDGQKIEWKKPAGLRRVKNTTYIQACEDADQKGGQST